MTEQSESKGLPRTVGAEIMLQDLPLGTRLVLRGGAEVEIVENPRDGQWVFVRPVGSDEEADLVFAAEVAEMPAQ